MSDTTDIWRRRWARYGGCTTCGVLEKNPCRERGDTRIATEWRVRTRAHPGRPLLQQETKGTSVKAKTDDPLLTLGEVAALFRVDPKTVTRWAAAGRIGSIRTPGGHRRFRESEVRSLLEGEPDAE